MVEAKIPFENGRWAKPDTAGGPAKRNLVEVGQVLRLTVTPAHEEAKPFWRFEVSDLRFIEPVGPIERKRREDFARFCGRPETSRNDIEYATWKDFEEKDRNPRRVVLITSKDTRAYGDFVKGLREQAKYVKVGLKNVAVQGERMVDDICRVLGRITPDEADMAFIVRGGGGWADLHRYDDPRLAAAIRACSIPVATGVGHAEDVHLVDHAADYAFTTPTGATEALRESKRVAYRSKIRKERDAAKTRADAAATASSWQDTAIPHTPPAPPAPPSPPRWDYPPVRPASVPLDWVSLTALVLAVTCGAAPVGLVMGLIGLYRTRGHRRRGRWAAVTASIMGAILTASLMIAGWSALEVESQNGVEVGDCLSRGGGSWAQVTRSSMSCDRPHRAQVFYRGEFDDRTARTVTRAPAKAFCRPFLSGAAQRAADRPSVGIRVVLEDASHPQSGDEFVCLGSRRHQQQTRGSLLD